MGTLKGSVKQTQPLGLSRYILNFHIRGWQIHQLLSSKQATYTGLGKDPSFCTFESLDPFSCKAC